ncbi:Cell division protein SepF, partial [Dysosmobacter welbionis]
GPVRLCLGLRPGAGPAVRLCGGHPQLLPHWRRRLSLFPRLYSDHYAGCADLRSVPVPGAPAGLADLLRQAGHQCAERGAGGAVDRHSQQQRPLQPGGLVCQRVSQRGEKPHHAAGADGAAGASAAGAAAGPSADGDAAPAGGGGQ